MSRTLFKEEQKFRQAWILIVIALSAVVWLYMIIRYIFIDDLFQKEPGASWTTLIAGVIPILIIYLFTNMKLITIVDMDGIRCRFSILQRSFKSFPKEEIHVYEIRKYKPIMEYGGWGIRVGRGRRGSAYNVSGNIGLQLYMKNGKKFLIGTRQPESLLRSIDKMMGKTKTE
jgi:hypothetical protein